MNQWTVPGSWFHTKKKHSTIKKMWKPQIHQILIPRWLPTKKTVVFNVAPSCSPSAPAGSPHRVDSGDSDWWLDVMKNGMRYDWMLIGFRMWFVSSDEVYLILILILIRTILWMSPSVMWVRSISFRMVVDVNGKFRVSSPVKPCTHPTVFSKWRRRLAMRRMS